MAKLKENLREKMKEKLKESLRMPNNIQSGHSLGTLLAYDVLKNGVRINFDAFFSKQG